MAENFTNGLDPAQLERLAILAEEMNEAGQAVMKAVRHGMKSRWPAEVGTTNRDDIERELGHVIHSIDRLIWAGDLDRLKIKMGRLAKEREIEPYLHHQRGARVDPDQDRFSGHF